VTADAPKRTWRAPRGHEIAPGRRVIERLGGGRRTEAYRCTDDATGTPVVVKVLRPGRTEERDVRMLRREARTLAALDHPGFPRLLDLDLEADPAWIVMTHVDGPHLSDLVDAHGPIELEQALPLARDVAAALDHLHGRGRVHLDVKPSNVGMGARPVLLDLGASRRIERAARLGPGVGTVTYLSPEQAAPVQLGVPGPASDVWGLGAVLLQATTGHNPLAVRREVADPDERALAAACRDAARGVPAALRDLVVACLATDPQDRPTAAEAAAWTGRGAGSPGGTGRRLASFLRGQRSR
jgi:serine/threonine protein kinase